MTLRSDHESVGIHTRACPHGSLLIHSLSLFFSSTPQSSLPARTSQQQPGNGPGVSGEANSTRGMSMFTLATRHVFALPHMSSSLKIISYCIVSSCL